MTSSYLLLHFLLFLSISFILCPAHGCHEEERTALLNFKSSLDDPSNRLSSWKESLQHRNCCDWHGIRCSDESLHVVSIDLRNTELENYMIDTYDPSGDFDPPSTSLTGKLCDSLFNINHLNYLDLSFNDFHSQEPEILFRFSELTKLTHLDLSYTNFSASISTHFTNISSLVYVDLSCYVPNSRLFTSFCLESSSTKWVRGLANLQVLRLSGIDLFEAKFSLKENFAEDISYLSNLRDLDISDCTISSWVFQLHQFHNLSRLSTLKMKGNYGIKFSSIQLQMGNLTSLSILDLSRCDLQGSIPYLPQLKELDVSFNRHLHTDLTGMFEHPWPRMQKLDISYTNATGSVIPSSISIMAPLLVSLSASNCWIQGFLPDSIYNLSRLQHLDISVNRITSSIHSSIFNLKDLNFLDLAVNKFQGSLPKSICEIFPLRYLDLSNNNMTGTIPSCITKLRNLSLFDASYNSFRGKVSLISLINELNLTSLDLSSNELTVILDQHLHPSKFTLKSLQLESCNMEGFIPTSICNFTLLEEMNLSYNNLTGTIPSCINKLKKLESINFSNNNLRGHLPLVLPQGAFLLDLSNNKFFGEISLEAGERLSKVSVINLNGNELLGSIPSSLCSQEAGTPNEIDFSDNKLSGIIPSSIGNCRSLSALKLSNNNFTGKVPNELAQTQLRILQLNNNNLDGRFPESILRLLGLGVLNLGNNNFEGIIPTGLGSLNDLMFISLRSNKFNGSIPQDITQLHELQILDLSMNNLSGPIPKKIGNLTKLTSRSIGYSGWDVEYQLVIKGTYSQFQELENFRMGIDLSSNILDGNIPDEIGLLQGLVMLNLSHNHFSSTIPENVGNMSGLDSLDLSTNRLSGHIPQSLTSIDRLGFLNLSHNNLSGKIPRGSHFDTLSVNGSAFSGNVLLCGFPLKKVCEWENYIDVDDATNPSIKGDEDDQENGKEKFLLYAIVAMGFAVGFWGLFFVLLIKKHKWWFPYWRLVNSVAVKIVEGCI